MSLFDKAATEFDRQIQEATATEPAPPAAASANTDARATETTVGGQTVTIGEPDTSQTGDDGTWLGGSELYGWPRGREALEAREIVQTSVMQAITNGIADQLLGGDLTFESDDDEVDSAEVEIQALLRDVLTGPHLMDDDLDDLITAAVEDMLGPGNAYWQMLPAEDGSLPVVSLVPLDALTIRHNFDQHGYPQDPPYWQARNAFASDSVATLGAIDPTPLQSDDLVVMRYPKGRRSHRFYPMSPSIQVRQWLEILANSTIHHNRFYADDEIPPGLIQVMNASGTTINDVKDKIRSASGDPRKVPVIGGEGGAQWIEMGGTAVNLDIIEEQRWFFQLCLASLGLGKQELGFIEDVNRSNGEVESSRIFKRITGPFAKQFEQGFAHIASQFDVYNALDQPFDIKLRFTDPREERAREERLRQMYNDGALPYRQYVRRRGDDDLADNDMTVTINGQTIDYGEYPKHVVEHLLREARNDPDANADMGDDEPAGGDE